jgi:hypothetical protein
VTDEQRGLLARRLHIASQQQPEILILRQLLLEFGGAELVAPPELDADLASLLADGHLMLGTVTEVSMHKSACHQNVAVLWRQGGLSGIGTGYALSGDLWRQHSWGVKNDCIIETTATRLKYFGLLLTGESADHFARLNPPD